MAVLDGWSDKAAQLEKRLEEVARSSARVPVRANVGTLVMALVALLFVGGVYVHSVRTYERLLGKAEEREARFEQRMKDLDNKWALDRQKLLELAQQRSQLQERVVYRDRQADAKIAEVSAPDRDSQRVADDVVAAYSFSARAVAPDLISFAPAQVQVFVATKLDRDRLAANLEDTNKQVALGLEREKVLADNLLEAQTQLKDARGVVDSYKKLANRTKKQRFFDGLKKWGAFAAGVLIGKALGA